VSLSGWLEGVTTTPPTFAMQDYLVHDTNSIPSRVASKIGRISDTLVFDFLVDGVYALVYALVCVGCVRVCVGD
jgi:hypothetical protein